MEGDAYRMERADDMYMHASLDTEKEMAHESCLCQSFINKK